MSILSTRRAEHSGRRSSRKNLSTTSASKTYDIYCINFYDNGLKALREEFKNQIKLGLRRFIFVIDLEEELENAEITNYRISRLSTKNKDLDILPTNGLDLALLRINSSLAEYDYVTRKIEAELNFNMLKYYQRNVPAQLKVRSVDSKKEKSSGVESTRGRASAKTQETTDSKSKIKISCFGVNAKEHHRVGKGNPLSKRLYIRDAPMNTTILIVIMGDMDNKFYTDLLARGEPLRGVIHFLPEKCAYDLLVPRPRREKQLLETIEKIHKDIHGLRKRTLAKPVGVLQQQLPQMSICQAVKYTTDIFDQLSWFLYDVQMLREQYSEYYLNPYHEINVKMPASTSMQDSFQMAESLSIQGHYLNSEMSAVHDDDATLYLYIESLMCTFGQPRELMTELEVLMLANPTSSVHTRVLDKIKVYANAFKSIIKLMKSERLIVEGTNKLLSNIVMHMDQKLMRNIYHACLEYNVLRRYFTSGYIIDKIHFTPYNSEVELQHLPKFAKLYLTDDSVTQRIIQLIDDFGQYKCEEIQPNVKLYTFKRCFNEVFEHQKEIVIPTRLCFRDFTLYEMEQFLQDLVTPQMFEDAIDVKPEPVPEMGVSNISLFYSDDEGDDDGGSNFDIYHCRNTSRRTVMPSEFIRPNSLKSKKLIEQQKEKDKRDKLSTNLSRMRSKESYGMTNTKPIRRSVRGTNTPKNDSIKTVQEKPKFIGLGPDHPMLTGYNLDDARQTIKVKTSNYYFEEGLISLYEEKWNFRQMNKCLSIEIDKQILHLTNQVGNFSAVAPNIRLQTPNGISLRLKPDGNECAKAVLNYPNGLSFFCQDTHAENIWSGQQSELNESRRLCLPNGCVVVFYNKNDTVLIMRYNGEVYRLYNYTEVTEEQEGEGENDSEFINACSTQSAYSSYKPVRQANRRARKCSSQTSRKLGGADASAKKATSLDISSVSSQTLAARSAKMEAHEMELEQTTVLFASIDPEIKFLEKIVEMFDLKYKHLKLTTSLGSVVHVEKDKIHCGKPIKVTEWHDYFANESYSMREDGVRMVWTQDSLRCYHSDGTLITTTTTEGHDPGINIDDIDKQISSSSSHLKATHLSDSLESMTMYINVPPSKTIPNELYIFNKSDENEIAEMEVEDLYKYDYSFVTHSPDSYLIQHKTYPGIKFKFTNTSNTNAMLETKVFAADDLEFLIYEVSSEKNPLTLGNDLPNEHFYQENISSEADPDEWTPKYKEPLHGLVFTHKQTAIDVQASNLKISLLPGRIKLVAQLHKVICDENYVDIRDQFEVTMKLKESLAIAFQNWVSNFHRFINCACPKWRTTYFLETTSADCRKKGFEMFKSVPQLGLYNFCAGNYFIDMLELKSVTSCMLHKLDWYDRDMAKFPRFPPIKKEPKIVKCPSVFSAR